MKLARDRKNVRTAFALVAFFVFPGHGESPAGLAGAGRAWYGP